MARYPKSGALTTGLILIALGVIFLVENLHAPFSAWRLLERYWPVIVIIIGFNKIFAYFFRRKDDSEAPDTTASKE